MTVKDSLKVLREGFGGRAAIARAPKPVPYDDGDDEPEEPRDMRWITLYDDEAIQIMQGWTGGERDPLYAISSMGGANYAWVFVDAIANLDHDIGRVQKIGRNKYQLGKGTFTKKEIDELSYLRDMLQSALDEGGEVRERIVRAPSVAARPRGIYSEMPFAAGDYVLHFREDRSTWSVDRVDTGGTHTTIGPTRGYGTTENVRKAIEYDAHVHSIKDASVYDAGGDELGVLKHGRVYFHPGSLARYPYQHRTGERVEASRGASADTHAATELVMFIENTSDLSPDGPRGQGRDVLLNALRKWKKGTYNPELAVTLFGYLVEAGAKQYAREFASEREWSKMFPPATRQEAARQLEASFRSSAERGEYDHVDTRTGAREAEASGGRGSYSLRQSQESATKSDAYFDGARIGSVRGPFSDRTGRRTFYDWTLNGPRGQAIGRAKTQTVAFNQLIRKHKEWRATGTDRSQVGGVREAGRSDRPIGMTYGVLPPFEEFEQDIRRPDPDYNDGRSYWPEGTLYPMELVNSHEIELAESFGLEEFEAERQITGRNIRVRGFKDNERAIYEFLEFLADRLENGDEQAGDLASSIMMTLGYEWI